MRSFFPSARVTDRRASCSHQFDLVSNSSPSQRVSALFITDAGSVLCFHSSSNNLHHLITDAGSVLTGRFFLLPHSSSKHFSPLENLVYFLSQTERALNVSFIREFLCVIRVSPFSTYLCFLVTVLMKVLFNR